jgi:hypothetical protein
MLTPEEVQWLLDKLCVDAGFCLPPEEQAKLRVDPPVAPIAFTDAVFLAEGLKPELAERHLYRGVRTSRTAAQQRPHSRCSAARSLATGIRRECWTQSAASQTRAHIIAGVAPVLN